MPPVINEKKCTACGLCAETCAEDIFFGSKSKHIPQVTYPEFCAHCSCCVYICKEGAIRLRVPFPMQLLYKDPQEKTT